MGNGCQAKRRGHNVDQVDGALLDNPISDGISSATVLPVGIRAGQWFMKGPTRDITAPDPVGHVAGVGETAYLKFPANVFNPSVRIENGGGNVYAMLYHRIDEAFRSNAARPAAGPLRLGDI